MKYFTREWYGNCQLESLIHFFKTIDENAKEYSERFFQNLYAKKMKNHKVTRYENDLKYLKTSLPKELLDSIADIRVAALGVLTKDNYRKLADFCNDLRFKTHAAACSYNDYFDTVKERLPNDFYECLSHQHDAKVLECKMRGNDYIIKSNYGRNYTFTFKNACLTDCQNMSAKEVFFWIYDEIYIQSGMYEVHILFNIDDKTTPFDLASITITADDIMATCD